MIRLALVYAWVGFGLAALLLINKGRTETLSFDEGRWLWIHVDMLLIGWMVQLALAVAYWILPRLPNSLNQRGRLWSARLGFTCLNLGIWAYSLSILNLGLGRFSPLGLALQLVGGLCFLWHAIPRIRPTFVKGQGS
jgi:hypothetical protein